MARTDRAGKFKGIFDIEGLTKIKNVASKIDNKWDRTHMTLDK